MTFAQNLKYLREINHITQEDLASYLKVTRSTIAGYETKGKQPDYEKLLKISSFFQVSVDFLLGNTKNKTEQLPNHMIVQKIDEHEFISAYRKLSRLSRQKLWEYLKLLQLYDQQTPKTTEK